MDAEERMTAAALDTLDVAQRSGISDDDLEREIRESAARLIWRRADVQESARRLTAFHESGHAVACCVCGIPFVMARLGVDDASQRPTLGSVILERPDPTDRGEVENFCIMLMSGVAAGTLAGYGNDGGDLDIARAVQVAAVLGYSDDARRDFLNLAGSRARDLVRDNFRWIQAVARQLLDRSTITAHDVRALRPVPDEAVAA